MHDIKFLKAEHEVSLQNRKNPKISVDRQQVNVILLGHSESTLSMCSIKSWLILTYLGLILQHVF